jgi:L-arabinokinase
MYQIIAGSSHDLADVKDFIATLNDLARQPDPEAATLLDPAQELIVSRAPGRLDVMGGIADYSGSLVLQLPTREATHVALQPDPAPLLRIYSTGAAENQRAAFFEMPLADFVGPAGQPVDYAAAQRYFQRDPARHWAAYVAGVFLVLQRERGLTFSQGARLFISSDVPEGKGVSSSAAIEVAVMQAVAAAYGVSLDGRELALLCQKVENLVVGAPCGVMDQMTAACGQANELLALLCQPAELQDMVTLPDEVAVWGLDSGVRHSVSGADYGSVRVGAFMGYRLLAQQAGLAVSHDEPGQRVRINDPRWGGYLANVTPAEFDHFYARHLPEQISGADFLSHYSGTTDTVTRIEPERHYAVRVPASHPVYEHFRVRNYAELLSKAGSPSERRLELLGELMYQSHTSYSACGLGSAGTDRLVELVRAMGPRQGLYGAKITGGGSGGTVAVLGRKAAEAAIEVIAETYAQETGHTPYIFTGSSPGAVAFGHLRLRRADLPGR